MARFALPASVTVANAGAAVRLALGELGAEPTAPSWEVDAAALRDGAVKLSAGRKQHRLVRMG